jgi:hypothetical protein
MTAKETDMPVEDRAAAERIEESIENARKAQRREQALLRSPVEPPANYPKKDIRRMAEEVREEFLRRG